MFIDKNEIRFKIVLFSRYGERYNIEDDEKKIV